MCLSYSYKAQQYNDFIMCYVIRGFKGSEVQNFDAQYLKMEENFEKQYWTKEAQNIELNNNQP